jgi:hypothetical protein
VTIAVFRFARSISGIGSTTIITSSTHEYHTPIGEPIADDENTACHEADNPDLCNKQRADATQRARAKDLLNGLRGDDICQQIRTKVLEIIDASTTRLWIWTNRVTKGGKTLLGDVDVDEVPGSLPPGRDPSLGRPCQAGRTEYGDDRA